MLTARRPAEPRERMKENERWAGHIVFLTITSAIAASLIVALAAIFADPGKISGLLSKILILLAALCVIAALGASLWASVQLSNYLVSTDSLSSTDRTNEAAKVTKYSAVALLTLFVSAVLLFCFLFFVTLFAKEKESSMAPTSWPSSATEAARTAAELNRNPAREPIRARIACGLRLHAIDATSARSPPAVRQGSMIDCAHGGFG
jgi:hypothetical protein